MTKFLSGDRVYLKMDSSFIPEPHYPVRGSKYECIGTVIASVDGTGTILNVTWDNGKEVMINGGWLELAEKELYQGPDLRVIHKYLLDAGIAHASIDKWGD